MLFYTDLGILYQIEYARKNIDGAHHKIQEKLSSIKEWRSNGHTPQECDAAVRSRHNYCAIYSADLTILTEMSCVSCDWKRNEVWTPATLLESVDLLYYWS